MGEYDLALKSILTRRGSVLNQQTGLEVVRWMNTELPEVRSQQADLLAALMLEYAVAIHRKFDRFPDQVVLYVVEAPLRMVGKAAGGGLSFLCSIVDVRELDGVPCSESEFGTIFNRDCRTRLTRSGGY